jgi:phage terminase small subunit
MGFANMQDYMGATDNGDPFLDFSKLTRAKAGALAEVAVEEFVDGRLRECARGQARQFKLHDKRAALVDLGRHLGMFQEGNRAGGVSFHVTLNFGKRPGEP